jgi:hypothetical protein
MSDSPAKGAPHGSTEQAIAEIVKTNPRRVTVTLTLPVQQNEARPTVTLEWGREDTNMALSDLLKKIEGYVNAFGK